MAKKSKGKRKVRHDLENDTEYTGLSKEEKDYLEQFNREWYYGSRYTKEYKINTDDEGRKECNRNNNRNNRDIFDVSQRSGTLLELTENEADFMEQASDEWEWQDVYKMIGKEPAVHVIFEQAKRDIENDILDLDVTLCRFFTKLMSLDRLDKRRRKKGK